MEVVDLNGTDCVCQTLGGIFTYSLSLKREKFKKGMGAVSAAPWEVLAY